MIRRDPMTDEEKEKAWKLYVQGYSRVIISKRLDVGYNGVCTYINERCGKQPAVDYRARSALNLRDTHRGKFLGDSWRQSK